MSETEISVVNEAIQMEQEGYNFYTKLAKKIKGLLCFVNLIPYNGEDHDKKPSSKSINEFKKILIINQVYVTQRYKFGTDIKAACGQLVFLKEKNNYLS